MERPAKPERGDIVIPQEYMPKGSPIANLTLPSGRDPNSLRYVPLYAELSALGIDGITPHAGKAELIRLYEAAVTERALELSRRVTKAAQEQHGVKVSAYMSRSLVQKAIASFSKQAGAA